MRRILTILTIIAGIAWIAYAANIKGYVVDIDGAALPGATARLIAWPDSTIRNQAVSGDNGEFSFSKVDSGSYSVALSMIGMDNVVIDTRVSPSDTLIDLGRIVMNETSVTLKEAVVTAVKTAVISREDTLEFNAGSFKTQPNASVEDLLKKLPGVEVSSDGSITSNGKTITKILVDGKEFFSDDTKMATKNLQSDMVDKVQIVDRKSDLARLTGVDDGEEETVINLTVKKNMKNGWFGTLEGGYGTDHRYEGSFNISTFTDNNQISIVGGGNNTNDLGFSDRGMSRFMSMGNSGGITESQRIGLNFNLGKTEKFRIGGNIFYTHSDRNSESRTSTTYLFPDSTSNMTQGSRSRDRGHNVNGNFRMEWKIDDYNTLDFRPNFSFNYRTAELADTSRLVSGLDIPVNSSNTRRFNHGTSWNFDGNLIYNHNFRSRPGRSFSIQAQYSFSSTRQHSTSWNDIEYMLRQEDTELLYRYMDNNQWNNTLGARLTWTEPLGDSSRGNFLQFAYRINYRFNNADKSTYNLPIPEGVDSLSFYPENFNYLPADAIYDPDLSNRFRNRYFNQELRIGYKKVNTLYNLEAGIMFAPSSSGSTDLINDARNIPTRWVWNIAPYFRLKYKFSKSQALRVDYRARTSSPSLTQLQPVADVSDPLHITVGNPSLKPTFTQTIGVHYNNFNSERQQSFFTALRAQYSTNVVVARTIVDSETGVRTTTYSNANGNANIMAMAMLNQPFSNRKWRFSTRLMANYNSAAGYINGDFNRSGNLNLAPEAGVTFTCDVFQMSLTPRYSFGMATNSLPDQPNRYTHNYGFNTQASLYLPFGLNLSTDLNFSKTSGMSQGFNSTIWNWNAELSYSLLRDKSLTLSVRAYDLLGQNKDISRSVSANMITDSRYSNLTRYVMFGISWTFNTMKNRMAQNPEPDGPPMPRGDTPQGPPPIGHGGPGGPGPMRH